MDTKDKNDGRGLDEADAKLTNNSTWWTPQGFVVKEAPAAYVELPSIGIWNEILKAGGYERIVRAGEEYSDLEIEINRHKEHFLVTVSGGDCSLSEFFVAKSDADIFFATWYVEFMRSLAQFSQSDCLERIAKTLTAFVRHGHGEDIINEYGDQSLDDEQRLMNWAAKEAK